MIKQVDQNLWAAFYLTANTSVTYFQDNMRLATVRWFTAHPTQITPREGFTDDQIVAITDVYHIMKANGHIYDGSGGAGTLQVNVTIQSRTQSSELQRIQVFMAETT